jgi:hypothetical protein
MMPDSGGRRRHVWVDCSGGVRCPGLVLAWRRGNDDTWEAQTAVVRRGSVLVQWLPATDLHPVTDDSWQPSTGRS